MQVQNHEITTLTLFLFIYGQYFAKHTNTKQCYQVKPINGIDLFVTA